jgi:hypothetical protein
MFLAVNVQVLEPFVDRRARVPDAPCTSGHRRRRLLRQPLMSCGTSSVLAELVRLSPRPAGTWAIAVRKTVRTFIVAVHFAERATTGPP